ncbi:O-antigen ligase family protein [Pseudarthrobacter sp. S3]|uniref:O-antigen ligase family protein n=1 Tax=Pseudarthrobacter sp. S3 TaxID=3418419 RepID=UPI003CE9B69B
MVALPIGITICGLLATIFCKANKASQCALFFVLALAVLVPSHSPSRDVLSAAVGGAVVVLVVAILRSHSLIAKAAPNMSLVLFILYSSGIMFFEADGPYAWFILLSCTSYLLVSLLVSQPSFNGTAVLYFAVPIFVVIQFLFSIAEEFLGVKAIWPLTNGTDFITHRLNPIAPWLAGRAMGSTSHPIPLGTLMAICLVVCLWVAINGGRRRYWLVSLLAATVILFSGTRSAILAVLVALAFWFSTAAGSKRLPGYVLGAATFFIIAVSVDPRTLPGLSGFYSSESYTHRADVLEFLPELMQRSLGDLVFGSGYGSIASLLQSSVFSGGSGIQVFDQEYIRTLTATGLVGFMLLTSSIVEGFRRGNVPSRLVIICLAVTFFSFDALSWNLLMTLFVVAASGPLFHVDERREKQMEIDSLQANNRGLRI